MERNGRKMQFERSRFHVKFGPEALFQRVEFKMREVNELLIHGSHFIERVKERSIPKEIINSIACFDFKEWNLVVAEVRNDKGKFVSSTWEKVFHNKKYWITIGFGNTIETIVVKDSSGEDKCIKSGEIYEFVEEVNKKLMTIANI